MTSIRLFSLFAACFVPGAEAAPPFEVETAKPAAGLTRQFERANGWTGGDVASSIPFGPNRSLWLFGDSFIGKIEGGRRIESRMISNAAAWQDGQAPLQFHWDSTGETPGPLLAFPDPDHWYWPSDGVVIDSKLYLICKVVRRAKGPAGFDFDWHANHLLRVENPDDDPAKWKIERRPLPDGPDAPRLGVACALDGDFLYIYGLFPARDVKKLHVPLAVARIRKDHLKSLQLDQLEYWRRLAEGDGWSKTPSDLIPLFTDAAAELSVSRIRGIKGWVACYTPSGIGGEIALRHAAKPTGPFSDRVIAYKIPNPGEKVFLYGAKAHPELSRLDGQIFITYCQNIGELSEHTKRPDVYFPKGVEARLRLK